MISDEKVSLHFVVNCLSKTKNKLNKNQKKKKKKKKLVSITNYRPSNYRLQISITGLHQS